MTKHQRKREHIAKMIEWWVGENQSSREIRRKNRRVDMRKGKTKQPSAH